MKVSIERVDPRYSAKISIEQYVESRLKRWASWFSGKDNPGLDYKSKSTIYRMMNDAYTSPKNEIGKPLPVDALAEEIEGIIFEMFQESLALKLCAIALREEYLSRKKHQPERAMAVGMTVTKFKNHVDRARVYLAGVLKERYRF